MTKNKKKYKGYPIPKTCIYCGNEINLVSNKEVYGRKRGNGMCYKCSKCDSYVGVHPDLITPLGILADKRLRELKKLAHWLFDPLWRNGVYKRSEAYAKLAHKMGIPTRECHFGWFDEKKLLHAIAILRSGL